MREWWNRLSPTERLLVGVGVPVVGLVALITMFRRPTPEPADEEGEGGAPLPAHGLTPPMDLGLASQLASFESSITAAILQLGEQLSQTTPPTPEVPPVTWRPPPRPPGIPAPPQPPPAASIPVAPNIPGGLSIVTGVTKPDKPSLLPPTHPGATITVPVAPHIPGGLSIVTGVTKPPKPTKPAGNTGLYRTRS